MPGITITLNEEELQELEQVILDEDIKDAMKLLNEIKKKVKESEKRICGMHREPHDFKT